MALINAVTPADKRAYIYCIADSDAKWLAFAAANQVLAGLVKNLPSNPRLIKTFDVDSATEAVGWIEDPELLESIVASDARTGVADAAKTQMRKVASCTVSSVPNQRNIEERTKRILSKHVSTWTEALVDTEVSWSMVKDAVEALSYDDFGLLSQDVLRQGKLHDSIPGFVQRLAGLFVKESSSSFLLSHLLGSSRAAFSVLTAWEGAWNEAFGYLADRVIERNDTADLLVKLQSKSAANLSVTQECIDLWIAKGRLDLLCATSTITDDQCRKMAHEATSIRSLVLAANVSGKASYVDIITEQMVSLGALDRSDPRSGHWRSSISVSLFNKGRLSKRDTVRNLCAMLEPRHLSEVLSSSYEPETASEILTFEDMVFVTETLGYKAASETLFNRPSPQEPSGAKVLFLKAVTALPGSSRLAKSRYRYLSQDWVFVHLAERLSSAFASNERAWESFWAVYDQTQEASFDELVELALTLS